MGRPAGEIYNKELKNFGEVVFMFVVFTNILHTMSRNCGSLKVKIIFNVAWIRRLNNADHIRACYQYYSYFRSIELSEETGCGDYQPIKI